MSSRIALFAACAALLVPAAIFAQVEPPAAPAPAAEEIKVEPAVETWVKTLGAKIMDPNELVRNSAQSGLTSVGRQALPFLRTLASGADELVAAEAKKVIGRIERNAQRGEGDRRAFGRQAGAAGEAGGNPMDQVLKDMKLSTEQETKVKEVQEKQREKSREIFSQIQDGTLTREEGRAALEEMRTETNKQFKEFMTEEQFKKYEEAQRSQGGRFGGGGRRRGGGGG